MFWYSREAIKFLKFAEHVGSDSKMTDTFCFLHDKSWNIRAGLALHAQISLSCKLKAFLWFCTRGQIIPLPLESVHPMPQLHSNKLKVHMLARLKYLTSVYVCSLKYSTYMTYCISWLFNSLVHGFLLLFWLSKAWSKWPLG